MVFNGSILLRFGQSFKCYMAGHCAPDDESIGGKDMSQACRYGDYVGICTVSL